MEPSRCSVLAPERLQVETGGLQVVAGDWLALDPARTPASRLRALAIVPRRTFFVRESVGRQTVPQPLAANIDEALIVCGLDQELRAGRLERYLALAWQGGARPAVILTKVDTVSAAELEAALRGTGELAPGAEVLAVSAVTGQGVPELAQLLLTPGHTAALLGPSGVGKSSLINALIGSDRLATGATRRDGKGRHTTTHGELVLVPGGGVLLDTPGLRSLGLWDAGEGLQQTFADVVEFAAGCRFSDCAHQSEPGCAVKTAVAAGTLDPARVVRWRKLERELESLAARQGDQQELAEAKRRWRQRSRGARGRSL
ncbi:MAG: ribosome small subunit-dependent GTPase A [Candidatus Dormibacteria bacterium]